MNNDSIFHSRAKVISEGVLDIRRRIIVNEITREMMLLEFTHPLVTLLETTATSYLKLDGDILKTSAIHSDYYGFFTSFTEILSDESTMKKLTDPLYREVWIKTETKYASRTDKPEGYGGTKYVSVPEDWIIIGNGALNTDENIKKWFDLPFPESLDFNPKFGGGQDCSMDFMLWSSQKSPEDNRAQFEYILSLFKGMGAYNDTDIKSRLSEYDREMQGLIAVAE